MSEKSVTMEDLEQQMCAGDEDDDEEWSRPVGDQNLLHHNRQRDGSNNALLSCQARPGQEKINHVRTIVHIDVDCFYAQVEMIHNPALRDVPLGIQQKYLVVTCNYVARSRGVTKLMGITEAKKKCPELVLVSGEDLTRYRHMSFKISEFLMKYTPNVERLGFDENYLDVTDMVRQRIEGGSASADVVGHLYQPQDCDDNSSQTSTRPCTCGCQYRLAIGSQIAADIRSALKIELGITCCAGVAHNKLLAKLVGAQHKPDQQTTIFPCHALSLVTSLESARHIPGIGWSTSKRLKVMGVETVRDLQRFPLSRLEEEFGVTTATTISQLSVAIDDSPVVTYSKPQMLSVEDSFRRCSSEKDAVLKITQLFTNLISRVQEDGRTPRCLRLTVRKANRENRYLHRESRQCNLPPNTAAKITAGQLDAAQNQLVSLTMTLFHKMVDTKRPFHLTLINVAFAKLEETASNDISSFFTTQSPPGAMSPPSQLCADRLCSDSLVMPSSTQENVVPGTVSFKDNVSPNSQKRKHDGNIACFFSKKQKVSSTVDECEQNTALDASTVQNQKKAYNIIDDHQQSTIFDTNTVQKNISETIHDCSQSKSGVIETSVVHKQCTDITEDSVQSSAQTVDTNAHEHSVRIADHSSHRSDCMNQSNIVQKQSVNIYTSPVKTLMQNNNKFVVPKQVTNFIDSAYTFAETVDRNVLTNKALVDESSHGSRDISLPSHVDPEVFVQLPRDIQEEILGTVSQQIVNSKHTPILLSKSVKRHCSLDDLEPQNHPCEVNQQNTEDNRFFLQRKKPIFSTTKYKVKERHSVDHAFEHVASPSRNFEIHGDSHTEAEHKTSLGEEICDIEGKSRSDSTRTDICSAVETDSDIHCHPAVTKTSFSWENVPVDTSANSNIEIVETRPHNSVPKSPKTRTCNVHNFELAQDKESSKLSLLRSPKMSVPKGVAADVFCALPADLQREVAAEMAIQKHGVLSSTGSANCNTGNAGALNTTAGNTSTGVNGNSCAGVQNRTSAGVNGSGYAGGLKTGLKKSQIKSPGKQNNLWNYLRKK